jgi:diketogulonate reductase-like aldo/keto reductase
MGKTFTLSNGVVMPGVGFGTWEITPDAAALNKPRPYP